MDIILNFSTTDAATAFAKKLQLSVTDDNTVTIPWDMLSLAKSADGVTKFSQISDDMVEFIIQGNVNDPKISALISDPVDLGHGFYHVHSTNGLELCDLVTSIDPNIPSTLGIHDVTTINNVNGTPVTDPMSSQGQWARIRIASTYRPLLTTFSYYDSLTDQSTSEVYVVDSGVDWTHPEFANIVHDDFWKASSVSDFTDNLGHGTAVSSCVAGVNVGIARNVKIRSVKIADTETFNTSMLDYNNAIAAILQEVENNPAITRVVNCSWAMAKNTFLESRIQALLDAGVTVVAAAGNTGTDISLLSPAGMTGVLTVGSIDQYDIPSGFNDIAPTDTGLTTNYGAELNIFAPGENVVVAQNGTGGYTQISGTSMSAGYVSGVAAQIAALFSQETPHPDLMKKVLNVATKDALLFTDTQFSEIENNLVHLIGIEDITSSLDLYLGTFNPSNNTIELDCNTIIDTSSYVKLNPDTIFTWSVSYDDTPTQSTYGNYIAIDSKSGALTVANPTDVPMPTGEIINIVRFKVTATNDIVTLNSPYLIFFHVDPTVDAATTQANIVRALSASNSTSVFMATITLK